MPQGLLKMPELLFFKGLLCGAKTEVPTAWFLISALLLAKLVPFPGA